MCLMFSYILLKNLYYTYQIILKAFLINMNNIGLQAKSYYVNLLFKGGIMTKDSQPDNKHARMKKCNYQIPIIQENTNHNPNRKKHSVKRQGIQSDHINQINVISIIKFL
jgi:hypothetical protein